MLSNRAFNSGIDPESRYRGSLSRFNEGPLVSFNTMVLQNAFAIEATRPAVWAGTLAFSVVVGPESWKLAAQSATRFKTRRAAAIPQFADRYRY